jgi:hypothetical protein
MAKVVVPLFRHYVEADAENCQDIASILHLWYIKQTLKEPPFLQKEHTPEL